MFYLYLSCVLPLQKVVDPELTVTFLHNSRCAVKISQISLQAPFFESVKVAACVYRVDSRPHALGGVVPLYRDGGHVRRAHERLANLIDTMI